MKNADSTQAKKQYWWLSRTSCPPLVYGLIFFSPSSLVITGNRIAVVPVYIVLSFSHCHSCYNFHYFRQYFEIFLVKVKLSFTFEWSAYRSEFAKIMPIRPDLDPDPQYWSMVSSPFPPQIWRLTLLLMPRR
jgi:hypothetical protein